MITLLLMAAARASTTETFDAGSIIVPMDDTWQTDGIVDAYGLVYDLLSHDIPVSWAVTSGKAYEDVDIASVST